MKPLIEAGADFSPCRTWRYRLWRVWGKGPQLVVVGLNPSTADETTDDPTVRRCLGFAERWGFDGLQMLNLFAYRATNPHELQRVNDGYDRAPGVGPENDDRLTLTCAFHTHYDGAVLAAWGSHGALRRRENMVIGNLNERRIGVACLGLTKSGQPKHPLYLPNDAKPIPFLGDGGRLCTQGIGS